MILGKMLISAGADLFSNKFLLGQISGGSLQLSIDYAGSWSNISQSFVNPIAVISSDGKYILVGEQTNSGKLYISSNGGQSFTVKHTITAIQRFSQVSMSETGQYQLAVIFSGGRMISSDYGNTWNTPSGTIFYLDCYVSSSGQYMVTCATTNGQLSVSTNYGSTWSQKGSLRNWWSCSISNDGQYITGVTNLGFIYKSSNSGTNWTEVGLSKYWLRVRMSDSGQYQLAIPQGTDRWYISSNYGDTWTQGFVSTNSWTDISVSKTGQYQYACNSDTGLRVYRSTNYGASFSTLGTTVTADWRLIQVCK